MANQYDNGKLLNYHLFSGGTETNDFLRQLGSTVGEIESSSSTINSSQNVDNKILAEKHKGERSRKYIETIKQLLDKIFTKFKRINNLN